MYDTVGISKLNYCRWDWLGMVLLVHSKKKKHDRYLYVWGIFGWERIGEGKKMKEKKSMSEEFLDCLIA